MKPVGINVRREVSQRKIATHRPRTAPNRKDAPGSQRAPSPDRPESAANWRKAGPSVETAKSMWYDESLNKDFVLASIYSSQEGIVVPTSPKKDDDQVQNVESPNQGGSPTFEGSLLSQMCHSLVQQHPELLLTDSMESNSLIAGIPGNNLLTQNEFNRETVEMPSSARSKVNSVVKIVDLGSALENDPMPTASPTNANILNQPSGELSIGTATQELSKHNASGIAPTMVSEDDKARASSSAQRFFFDMWLADHGKQGGTEGTLTTTDALNIELMTKLDHSLRQAAFEYEKQQEEMSLLSIHDPSSTQQIEYIKKVTNAAIEVFDRLVKEWGDKLPLLRTLRRALNPSIFVRHSSGIIDEDDEASVVANQSSDPAEAAAATAAAIAGTTKSNKDEDSQPLVVERWIRAKESLGHLSSVHEGLNKDFARINHELHECKRLLAEQEEKYQIMARAQARTFEDLKDSNSERLKYMSEVQVLRKELSVTEERWADTQDARKAAEENNADLQRQLSVHQSKINALEGKVSDQAAVIEKFKKELNELKKERRELKKDLVEVNDKMKRLRHTLIHDRKETLESYEHTKAFARKVCKELNMMEEDIDEEPIVESSPDDITAKPKTLEEIQEEENHFLEMEFTDRAWQMGSYLQHLQSMLADEIRRYQSVETDHERALEELKAEKEKIIKANHDHVDHLHKTYKAQLTTEIENAQYMEKTLNMQLQQRADDIKDLEQVVKKHEDKIQMLQHHSRQIEIELTHTGIVAREQADIINMAKEDSRADEKVIRKEFRILELEAQLKDCTEKLVATEEELEDAKKKLEVGETAAIELAASWEAKYHQDMQEQKSFFEDKLQKKCIEIDISVAQVGMLADDLRQANDRGAVLRKTVVDNDYQLRQFRLALQTKESENLSLRQQVGEMEEMVTLAQATIEDLNGQLLVANMNRGGSTSRNVSFVQPSIPEATELHEGASDGLMPNDASVGGGIPIPAAIQTDLITNDEETQLLSASPSKVSQAKMQLLKGITPINRTLSSSSQLLRQPSMNSPGKRSSMSALIGVPRKEFVTTMVQTDEMGDMFAFVATKYKSVTISAKNSPEAWEYLSIRMHQEQAKLHSIIQANQKDKKLIEEELARLREENREIMSKIPAIINSHIEHMAGLRMMEMVKEEAERRMHESAEQQMQEEIQLKQGISPLENDATNFSPVKSSATEENSLFLGSFSNDEGSAPVNNKPQKLQLVDINMLYKLTQKIKKTLDWKKTVLPSNMIYGFKKEDTYEPIQDEDEDEFDESRIVTKEIETKPKRKMTDVDVEPFFYEKLERRTQLRQFTNAKYYNRGTQTWDEESIVASRHHNHLLDKGSDYHIGKAKIMFPHRAQSDIDYAKMLMEISPKQLSQPFIGYIRMNEKQYAREVGLLKIALRECRGMYEKLLEKIHEQQVKHSTSDDPSVPASWKDMEGSVKEYNWIFDPKVFIGRLVSSGDKPDMENDGDKDEFDDEYVEDGADDQSHRGKGHDHKKKKKKHGKKPKSFLSFSPLPGHMDPIDITAQSRMIVSYRQALEKERDLIAQGNTRTEDGTERSLITHAIEDLIVDLHTRMEIHGGWQALLYRSDGTVDYDMDYSAFSEEEQRDILIEQKKLLRIQLQTQQERASKAQENLLWELKRFRKQEQRRAQRRGNGANDTIETLDGNHHGRNEHVDDDEKDACVQTMANWQWLQPVTYQTVQRTLSEVIDTLRYMSSLSAIKGLQKSAEHLSDHTRSSEEMKQSMGEQQIAVRMVPQLPPLDHNHSASGGMSNLRPKTAVVGPNNTSKHGKSVNQKIVPSSAKGKRALGNPSFLTDHSSSTAKVDTEEDDYVSFVQKKPLLQSSISPSVRDTKKVGFAVSSMSTAGSKDPHKKRPWSSAQWNLVKDNTKQQYSQLQPLLLSASTSILSTSYSPTASSSSLVQQSRSMKDISATTGDNRMCIMAPSSQPHLSMSHSLLDQGSTSIALLDGPSHEDKDGSSLLFQQSLLQVEGHEKPMVDRKDLLNESSIVIFEQVMEQKRQEEFLQKLRKEEEARKLQEMATMTMVTDDMKLIYQPGDKVLLVSNKVKATNDVQENNETSTTEGDDSTTFARSRGVPSSPTHVNADQSSHFFFSVDHFLQDPWQLKYQLQTVHSLCEHVFNLVNAPPPMTPALAHPNNTIQIPQQRILANAHIASMNFSDSVLTTQRSRPESGKSQTVIDGHALAIGEAALEEGSVTLPAAATSVSHVSLNESDKEEERDAHHHMVHNEDPFDLKHVRFSREPSIPDIVPQSMKTNMVSQGTNPDLSHKDIDEERAETKAKHYESILLNTFQDTTNVHQKAKTANYLHHHYSETQNKPAVPYKPALSSLLHTLGKKQLKGMSTDLIHHAVQLYDAYGEHWQALQQCEDRLRQLHNSHGHLSDLKALIAATGLEQSWLQEEISGVGGGMKPQFGSWEDARNHYANKLLYQRLAEHFQTTANLSSPSAALKQLQLRRQTSVSLADDLGGIAEQESSYLDMDEESVVDGKRSSLILPHATRPTVLGNSVQADRNPVVSAYVQRATAPVMLPNGRKVSSRPSYSHSTFAIQALANTTLVRPPSSTLPQSHSNNKANTSDSPSNNDIANVVSVKEQVVEDNGPSQSVPAPLQQRQSPTNNRSRGTIATPTTAMHNQQHQTASQGPSQRRTIANASPTQESNANNKSPTQSRLRKSLSLVRGASAMLALPSPNKSAAVPPSSASRKANANKTKATEAKDPSKSVVVERAESPLPELTDLNTPEPPVSEHHSPSITEKGSAFLGEFADMIDDEEDLFATLDALEQHEQTGAHAHQADDTLVTHEEPLILPELEALEPMAMGTDMEAVVEEETPDINQEYLDVDVPVPILEPPQAMTNEDK